ncbi:MAG: nucleoside phosphorylase [Clostridia bacterium]|nr:nucleoside phosphorylase [Clostridia bacterium]
MLLEEFDPDRDAVISPDMIVRPIPDFPEVTVSCFSYQLFESTLALFDSVQIGELHSAVGLNPIYRVEYKGKRFAFFQSRVGEPLCVAEYEDLIAMGSRRLILMGNCGVLDRSIEDCGIILPTSAIRDEGTSYHYLPPSDTIEVNRKWRDTFKEVLKECGYPYVEGTTWTTDAVYRETRGEGKPPKGTGCHLRGDGMRRHAGPV